MRQRSSRQSGGSSNGKRVKSKGKTLLDGNTFRISKINLQSGGSSELRLTNSHFRKSLLVEPTMLETHHSSHNQLKVNISSIAQRTKAALAVAPNKESVSPKKNATVIIERASTIIPLNPYFNVQQVRRTQTHSEQESKDFKLEAAKISRKDIGPVRAYAANTRASPITDLNYDRLSIVTNLQSTVKAHPNTQVSFFSIYDGHNGAACAQFLRDNLHVYLSKEQHFPDQMVQALQNSLKKIQADYLKVAQKKGESCGSSALVVLVVSSNTAKFPTKCVVGCVGNSRAVLSRNCGGEISQLSVDHSPHTDREYRRVMKAGGSVYQPKSSLTIAQQASRSYYRVIPGKLKCSRAIGDYELKSERFGYRPGIIIGEPEVDSFPLENADFLLMASDGVFEALTNVEVVKAIWAKTLAQRQESLHEQAGEAATTVLYQALRKSSIDCLSGILICFEGYEQTVLMEEELRLPDRDIP